MVDQDQARIPLGHITGVSGLKGWVKVHSDTHPRENIVAYRDWWLEQSGQWRQVKVLEGRPQGKTIVASIDGVSDPEQANALIGARISVDRDALPALGKGEYYWTDLIGMQVHTADGVHIGTAIRLFETGANDVLVVSDERESMAGSVVDSPAAGTSKEVLVPWLVPDVISEVNMDERVITVDWDPDF